MRATNTRLLTAATALLLLIKFAESCYPPDFKQGYVTATRYPVRGQYPRGTLAYFRCYEGYKLKGYSSVECGYDGNWMEQIPMCYTNTGSCKSPDHYDYHHEKYNKDMYNHGEDIYFKCAKGYYAPKDIKYNKAHCQSDGKWDNMPYECYKYCNNPKTFFGGEFHPDKPYYKYHDKVYYRCPRYHSRYIYSTCGMDGGWKQAKQCSDYCKMSDMDHGYYEPKKEKYYYGDMVKHSCDDKHYMHYDDEEYDKTMCGEDGTWDKKRPMCKGYCEAPNHKMYYHRQYSKSMYKHGEKIYFYCMEHYYRPEKYEYSASMCKDGKWDKVAYKCEKRCTAYDHSDYNHKPYGKEVYGYGEKMMYECMDGYYKSDNHDYYEAKCRSNGEWDKKPYKCLKYCKKTDMMHGSYRPRKDIYKYGEKMYYKCDDGYTMYYKEDKYDYNECDKMGKWKHMQPMCKMYCQAPEMKYGNYRPIKMHYNVGDRMYYGCNDGYRLYYGEDWYEYNTCQSDGKWEYNEPSCRKVGGDYCNVPDFEHGVYSPSKSKYVYGDKVYYTCKDGYKLYYEGDKYDHSTCMSGGNWDKKAPMCKKMEIQYCKAPYIMHGFYEPMKKMYDYMDRIYYKCKDGYKLFYDEDWFEYATCGKDGSFDFKPPKCRSMKEKYCMAEDFMHGDYSPKMKMYMTGDRMYHKCHEGYRLYYDEDWYEYRTCGKDGFWDFKPPTCRKIFSSRLYCYKPNFAHGSLRPTKNAYSYGDKVYYDCHEGYMKYYVGEKYEYSTCKSDGMWDHPAPMCKSEIKNYCLAPHVMHGSYYPIMKMYNPGDRLRYRCGKGYEMHYDSDRYEYTTCGKDGYWDKKSPKCKDMKMNYCSYPTIEHGMYKPMRKMYTPGDHLYYSCKEGYMLFYGEDWYEHNICKDDGMWTYMAPECRMANKAYCDTPMFKYGSLTASKRSYAYGEKVSYKCHDGYDLFYMEDWFEENICKSGGYWQFKHPICKKSMEKYCYPPDFHHGNYYPMMRKYSHGARMSYRCDHGYKKVYHDMEYEYSTCLNGKWDKKSPKCMDMKKKYCMAPKMNHGSYEPIKKMYMHDDKVYYKCKDGYYMHHEGDYYKYSTCKEDGIWDRKPPMCKEHDKQYCMPKRIMHGVFRPKKSRYNYGDRIYYNCDSGYDMRYYGRSYNYVTCQSGGKWDNDEPLCMNMKKNYCSAPEVHHSDYSPKKTYYGYGDRIYITCHDGYYKYYSGNYKGYSTCNNDGQWDKLPECKMMAKKYCKSPMYSDYHHKSYAKKQYMPGEYVKYDCDYGYYAPSGMKYDSALCKSDGTWANAPYKCMKYCMADEVRYGYYMPMKKYYKHGERISYKCKDSYNMKFQDSDKYDYMTCQSDGNWNKKAPMCMKHCYAPSRYRYGEYYPKKYSFDYGEKITFQCYRRYSLSSDMDYVQCGHNGKWRSPFPSCNRF